MAARRSNQSITVIRGRRSTSKRGFGGLDQEPRERAARKGSKASHRGGRSRSSSR